MSSEDRAHSLVYGLAVGRVKKDAKLADWKKEDQVVLASNLSKEDTSDLVQTLRTHFKSILRRGAPRFKGGKRIRLKSGAAKDKEENSKSEKEVSIKSRSEQRADDEREALNDINIPKYEVHLLAYSIVDDDEDESSETSERGKDEENQGRSSRRKREREKEAPENPEEIELKKLARAEKRLIILMAATSIDFSKYHRIAELIRDFKTGFLNVMDNLPAETMWNSKPGGSIQKSMNSVFDQLTRRYGSSELRTTEVKVEQVKEAIGESVRKALTAVEKLEDMDEKSVTFEDKAKQFEKKSRQMKTLQKKNYYVITGLVVALVIGLLLYFIIPAATAVSGSSVPPPLIASSSSSSSTGSSGNYSSSSSTGSHGPSSSSSSSGGAGR